MTTLVLDFFAETATGDNVGTIRRAQHVWNEVWRAGSIAALTSIALVAIAVPASAATAPTRGEGFRPDSASAAAVLRICTSRSARHTYVDIPY